ncbi:nicotinate (nicotinamide) nucleotide adenylyltransferase [Yunchengibacter salinarum]|uniref:nicotinate (nicotinamide) nucleotide adenylyltransferase n=1 Tax=Yunchengibacter salinarum TaxID=3133399 RepID=UPI0035B63A00
MIPAPPVTVARSTPPHEHPGGAGHPAGSPRLDPLLLDLAARWRGQTVGLYGGSFNPAHDGHAHVAENALKRLGLDAVWLLVSPGNPLKAAHGMAPFGDRLASARRLAARHCRLAASNAEARLGTRHTLDTITALQARLPHTRFVWLMGADSAAQFHRWYRWQALAKRLPIAIFDRPSYTLSGQRGALARRFPAARTRPSRLVRMAAPAWSFIIMPRHAASATGIRHRDPAWLAR